MTTVQDVMTPDPCTLDASAPMIEAARQMRDRGIGDVIVVDHDHVAGIVTDRDLAVRGIAGGRDPQRTPLSEVCTPDPLTLAPDDDVEQAVERMRHAAVRRLPVVDHDRPVGVVSLGDLALERDPRSALADISAEAPNN